MVEAPPAVTPSAVSRTGRLLALCLSLSSGCLWPVSRTICYRQLRSGIDGVRSIRGGCHGSGCAGTARATAGESGIDGLLEEPESVFSKNLPESTAADECADSPGRVRSAHATAGESGEIIGSSRLSELEFPSLNSSGCVAAVACARLSAVPGLSATASSYAFSPASFAVVAHARSTSMHGAHNSCSDTGRNLRCTGGLLPVCKIHQLQLGGG